MTVLQWAAGIVVGFGAGVLAGAFGVGGGIVTTPAVNVILGGTAIQAIATPLPVIFPTSLVGAFAYARAGQASFRAAAWAAGPGSVGAIGGAILTEAIDPHVLLVITAALLAWSATGIIRDRTPRTTWVQGATSGWAYAAIGLGAGFVSGLLGVGGGIVMVPVFTLVLGMPLKRALGTSLVIIAVLVIPGTLTHWALGNIDWSIFLALTIGVVPGAWIGARLALGSRDRTLRMAVGLFLFALAIAYGARELVSLVGDGG